MLIDSDFHDYYDTALSLGVDKTCPYLRKEKIISIEIKQRHMVKKSEWASNEKPAMYHKIRESELPHMRGKSAWNRPSINRMILGFAGKIYPFIKMPGLPKHKHDVDAKPDFIYDLDKAIEILNERHPKRMIAHKKDKRTYGEVYWLNGTHPDNLADFFKVENWGKFVPLFETHKVPIFIIRSRYSGNHELILNPTLKDFGFIRVKDPYTAFQEIHQFLSGVLGIGERMTAKVGNKDRIAQRGFNKFSFRKDPTKKKGKK
jgi:hypothetical protein